MKATSFILMLGAFMLMLNGLVLAAPITETIINNATKECAVFLAGDECSDCIPPPGWQSLGRASCPKNYTTSSVRGTCKGIEVSHCCTKGHSGASGECSNLVRNDLSNECAFVEDVTNSTIPAGWLKKPADISLFEWQCPLGYSWISLSSGSISNPAGKIFVDTARESDFLVDNKPAFPDQWNWITNTNTEASWTFYSLPADTDIYLYITPLITNKINGGSGYSSDVDISFETRSGAFQIRTVHLFNPQMQYAADSRGWGYQAYGLLEIPRNQIPADAQMNVKMKITQGRTEHMGVNNGCCVVEWHY
jgi:hypothetical protein